MTQYEFIQQRLLPGLPTEARVKIAPYISSRFDIEPCIRELCKLEAKLSSELAVIQNKISMLKMIK